MQKLLGQFRFFPESVLLSRLSHLIHSPHISQARNNLRYPETWYGVRGMQHGVMQGKNTSWPAPFSPASLELSHNFHPEPSQCGFWAVFASWRSYALFFVFRNLLMYAKRNRFLLKMRAPLVKFCRQNFRSAPFQMRGYRHKPPQNYFDTLSNGAW